ncbi:MAG: family 78 glycoside hydrolase catalytic domain [Bacteroidota bacterium]|nr:family 78 glycoside hydrolase catalytic domain [Bacteroidota bacterium]
MKKILSATAVCQLFALLCAAQVNVQGLLTENLPNPVGLDSRAPRFSWRLVSKERKVLQTAYEIRVAFNDPNGGVVKFLWTSGKVASDESLHVPYGGPALDPGKKYYWHVRVWDNKGRLSPWSLAAYWRTGLYDAGDWKARWITPGYAPDTSVPPHANRPSPLLRKEFDAGKRIRSAIAYITAHGLYEASINGRRIGDGYLTPGWTSYNKRLQYQVYDVTDLIEKGKNAIGVTLGNGWYRGYIGFSGQRDYYGKDISLLFQLALTYADGSTDTIVSDDSWKSSTGPILNSEIYDGEIQDTRLEKPGWAQPGYDDRGWSGVRTENFAMSNLVASSSEPVKKHESFRALRLIVTPRGERLADFGQNLVGWVTVKVKGHAGDTITISHAEVLDKAGNFYTDNLRAAHSQDRYVLSGKGEETLEPHFTFHGFRYIRIEGLHGDLSPEQFNAVALYSDMPQTGEFSTSNPLINQLQHNIQWGQRGNFLDVPTDCPQRDERLGWTGDAQVFSRTAAFNRGVENFFSKWLKDVAADQLPSGAIPFVIPNVVGSGTSAGWADVCTIIPWNVYLAYGDRRVLEQQYTSMKAWVEYMHGQSRNDLWNTGFHFGDWLFYRPQDDNDGKAAVTDKYLIAQCFYARSTQLLINAAGVLGKKEDSVAYAQLLQRIKEAYLREYMTPNGRLVSGTQTAYVLALQFDMLPDAMRAQAAERLAENIRSYDYHLTTGFLGTPYLCHVLSRYGYYDIAFRLLMQDSYPSWLYPVKMGATTIWERWDGIRPDSSFQTPGMNSFNHYAYGAIGDWMYRVVAGIDTYEDGPGYKHCRVWPHAGGGLSKVGAALQTGYGPLSSSWQVTDEGFVLDVDIPANTRSTVYLPVGEQINAADAAARISESGQALGSAKDIGIGAVEKGYIGLELGSGTYHFEVRR